MSKEEIPQNDRQFYQVFGGTFRTRVPEGTPDALERKLEKGPNAGKMVYEREVKALFGYIESVAIEDSDYGKQVKITLDKNEDGKNPILTFGVESKDGRDILKKLPGIDYSKEVRIMPYRFTPNDKPDEISGISIFQQDDEGKYTVKIENFFFDPVNKTYLHDFPTIDWDNSDEAGQKIYKIQRDAFLVKYVQENVVSKVSAKKPPEAATQNDEELDPSEIPF